MQSHDAAPPQASSGADTSHGSRDELTTDGAAFSPGFAEFERLAKQGNLILSAAKFWPIWKRRYPPF
jgi:hypothetical protein